MYPSMTINGNLIEQVRTIPSDDGIGPNIVVCVLRDQSGNPSRYQQAIDGLGVVWQSPGVSTLTIARRWLKSAFGAINLIPQDRGILYCNSPFIQASQYINSITDSPNGYYQRLASSFDIGQQVLAGIMGSDPLRDQNTARCAYSTITSNPYAAILTPLFASYLPNAWQAYNSTFPLGSVAFGIAGVGGPPPVSPVAIANAIDNDHCLALGGIFGTASSVSASGQFCPTFQSKAEQNFVSISTGYGPVHSRYTFSTDSNGKTPTLDVVTLLTPGQTSATFAYATLV